MNSQFDVQAQSAPNPGRPPVHVFTRPSCAPCDRATAALDRSGRAYDAHDVTRGVRNADAGVFFSGTVAVPQVFVGARRVETVEDLERLAEAGRLDDVAAGAGELPLAAATDDELAAGSADLPLRSVLPTSDGSQDPDPETWPILRFYREFFGFWPNTFAYLHHWPEAYKLFVYCQNYAAIDYRRALGLPGIAAVGYATSDAHGCSYCRAHTVATGGDATLATPALLAAARAAGDASTGPMGPFEVAVADLAAAATRNEVTEDLLRRVRETSTVARTGQVDPQTAVEGTALIAASFGFLNVFNDLTSLSIEGDWARQAQTVGIDPGRHGADDANPHNLDHELPAGGPSMADMMGRYAGRVADAGGVAAYATAQLGLVPAWVRAWPERARAHHLYLYAELMEQRDHSLLPAELKHLMARVSAVARGHAYLAAVEGYLAHRAATRAGEDDALAVRRVRSCYAVATRDPAADVGSGAGDPFDEAERAALRLAWLSAQQPLLTPRRFVEPVIARYGAPELAQLLVVAGVASMVQRAVAITRPSTEPEVERFLDAHDLPADLLDIRYPRQVAAA